MLFSFRSLFKSFKKFFCQLGIPDGLDFHLDFAASEAIRDRSSGDKASDLLWPPTIPPFLPLSTACGFLLRSSRVPDGLSPDSSTRKSFRVLELGFFFIGLPYSAVGGVYKYYTSVDSDDLT